MDARREVRTDGRTNGQRDVFLRTCMRASVCGWVSGCVVGLAACICVNA